MNYDLTENSYNDRLENIPTYNELIDMYTKDAVLKSKNSGSFNIVMTYITDDAEKIAIRTSKQFIFERGPLPDIQLEINPLVLGDTYEDYFLEEVEQSKKNWINASNYDLCPKIYYFGYYKKQIQNTDRYELYFTIVSKAYDTDLHNYYNNEKYLGYQNKQYDTLAASDKDIAMQLVDLLNKTSSKLKLICFDIKPGNCVIDITTNEVKLIDWDGDWCQDFSNILKSTGADSQRNNINLINQIVMANHFYTHCQWNIFAYYFNYKIGRQNLLEKQNALSELFCNLPHVSYQLMANHYFGINIPDCQELFSKLLDRSFRLNNMIHDYDDDITGNINNDDIMNVMSIMGGKKNKKSNKINKKKPITKKYKKHNKHNIDKKHYKKTRRS